ncbi:MAG: ATP-binding protein [Bacteroidota bacterium]
MSSQDTEYKEMFYAEAFENQEELNKLLTMLEKNPEDKNAISSIFRITHTLKGNAMGLGFDGIAGISHAMEDLFAQVQEKKIELSSELFSVLFSANDKLGDLIDSLKTDQKVSYKGILAKLRINLDRLNAEKEKAKQSEANSAPPAAVETSSPEVTAEPKAEPAPVAEVQLVVEQPVAETSAKEEETTDNSPLDKEELSESAVVEQPIEEQPVAEEIVKEEVEETKAEAQSEMVESTEPATEAQSVDDTQIEEPPVAETVEKVETEVEVQSATLDTAEAEVIAETEEAQAEEKTEAVAKEEVKVEEKESLIKATENAKVVEEVEELEVEELHEERSSSQISFSDQVQIPVKKLDDLLNLVGELIIEKDSLIAKNEKGVHSNMYSRLHRITSDMQYGVMDIRLVQVGSLFNKFHRVVRDVANIESKKVNLVLEGSDIEIDRNILKIISDSLVHLVRNAVSHGVETPENRTQAGKKAEGTLILRALNDKDTVVIEVEDDGKGIDTNAIKNKAIEKGIITKEYADTLNEEEIRYLIFEPGFSNAEKITEISGRGVGMDVVKKSTESIGGQVTVESTLGKGSKIILRLPSSMAVKGALLFELNQQEFAIPLAFTEAVVSLSPRKIHKVSRGLMANYLEHTMLLVFLNDLYDLPNLDSLRDEDVLQKSYNNLKDMDENLDVLIVTYNGKYVGFVVDKLLQQKEIVEKTLDKPLDKLELFSGATILGNGNICLVLNVATIIEKLFKEKRNLRVSYAKAS